MSKTKKTLALVLSFVLVIALTIVGTIAYLTSTPGAVTNTFTVGKVEITLDETDVDLYGVKDGDSRVTTNNYKLIPGHTYVKDPTVHVQPGSEKCYVFVKVVDSIAAIEDTTKIADQITAKEWTALSGVDNVYYKVQDEVAADATAVDLVVFENFKVKGDADVSSYAGKTVVVTAYAIQFDGFDDAAAAWAGGNFS